MGLAEAFNSVRSGQISAISLLVEAGLSLYRGEKRTAALLMGAAVLAYRWSAVGFVAQILYRIYRRIS